MYTSRCVNERHRHENVAIHSVIPYKKCVSVCGFKAWCKSLTLFLGATKIP